jgi:hypothetical protein
MPLHECVEQRDIGVVHPQHVNVLGQVCGVRRVMTVGLFDLRLEAGDHRVGKQAIEAELASLLRGERVPFVQQRVAQHVVAPSRRLENSLTVARGHCCQTAVHMGLLLRERQIVCVRWAL